ncbi:MAG: T9SS type A sorting domain-containing protein [Flavobacteriales bacterium]|nr:T9SS type A sorting domain-containing protein [Flavobacteriales bacterium]
MRKRHLTAVLVLGLCANVHAQLYVTNGNTLTIQTGAVVHSDGDVMNNGSVAGGGFLNMFNTAQVYSGTGAISNLRVSGGASVTPANSVTLGNALDVTSGSDLTVPTGQYILVNGPLTNAGTFTVENSGSLVQTIGSTLTNSGTFHVLRQGSSASNVYNYWSSPITSGSVPGGSIYRWNPNTSTQDYADDTFDPGWISFSGTMQVGSGYASLGGDLATFTGTANNGPIPRSLIYYPYNITNTGPGTPFNLMGNPYPCAISAAQLVLDNTNVNGSIYFWDDDLTGGSGYSTTDYAVWNHTGGLSGSGTPSNSVTPKGFIASGQGFMVRALNGSAALDFNNGQRVTGPNSQFFRMESEPQRLYISLESTQHFNQILIGLVEDATDGEDRLYDATKIRGSQSIALSAVDGDMEYAIMAFPPPMTEKTIPLNVFLAESGTYTFHSNTIEGFDGYEIYLEDRSTFTYYPMSEGTQVPFQLNAGDIAERFYLHIGSELVTGVRDEDSPAMRAWIYDGMLNVNLFNFGNHNGQLEMLDMAGRKVWASGANVSDRFMADVSDLSRGAYLVRMTSQSGIFTEKVIR